LAVLSPTALLKALAIPTSGKRDATFPAAWANSQLEIGGFFGDQR
jgi:hypothetical protein